MMHNSAEQSQKTQGASAWVGVTLALALVAGTAVSAQAAEPAVPAQKSTETQATVFDPLEPWNRTVHGVNYVVDHTLLRPISYAYRDGVPVVVRSKVTNVLRNLKEPVVAVNDLLQGSSGRAGSSAMRFLINSTVGVLGIFDVAGDWGYAYHDEDFGQTLGTYGVGEGFYLELPLLGPSNARDSVGLAVDWFMDPARIYVATQNPDWGDAFTYGRFGATALDKRTAYLDVVDEVEKSSIDTYASMRSMYHQSRQREIANGTSLSAAPAVSGDAFDEPAR